MTILRASGCEPAESGAGCCGMAGSFGYEIEHYEVSRKIGAERLFPKVEEQSRDTVIAVTGVSCREQIGHFTRTAPGPYRRGPCVAAGRGVGATAREYQGDCRGGLRREQGAGVVLAPASLAGNWDTVTDQRGPLDGVILSEVQRSRRISYWVTDRGTKRRSFARRSGRQGVEGISSSIPQSL